MKTLLYILIVTVVAKLPTAQAATCTDRTSNKCVATLFTRETCNSTSKICECIPDYLPIYTGCAAKPMRPEVKLDDVTRAYFIAPGANVVLVCTTRDTAPAGVTMTFQWKLNDVVSTSVTSQTYSITNADSTKLGTISCKVIFRTENFMLESDYSNPVTLILLSSASTLSLEVSNTSYEGFAALNTILKPTCKGAPYGVRYTFQLSNNQTFTSPITFTANMINTTIKCVLDSVPGIVLTTNASNPLPMPKEMTGAVSVELKYLPSSEILTFYNGTTVTLTCLVREREYLDPNKQITYTFADSKNPSPVANGNNYTVTPTTGEHTVSCNATYDGKTSTTASVIVTFTDANVGLPTPALKPEGGSATVAVGSRLVLNCGNSLGASVIYTWTKDGSDIFRQNDRVIQIGSVVASDKGSYMCQARLGNYVARSNTVFITVTSHATAVISSVLLLVGAAWVSLFM